MACPELCYTNRFGENRLGATIKKGWVEQSVGIEKKKILNIRILVDFIYFQPN